MRPHKARKSLSIGDKIKWGQNARPTLHHLRAAAALTSGWERSGAWSSRTAELTYSIRLRPVVMKTLSALEMSSRLGSKVFTWRCNLESGVSCRWSSCSGNASFIICLVGSLRTSAKVWNVRQARFKRPSAAGSSSSLPVASRNARAVIFVSQKSRSGPRAKVWSAPGHPAPATPAGNCSLIWLHTLPSQSFQSAESEAAVSLLWGGGGGDSGADGWLTLSPRLTAVPLTLYITVGRLFDSLQRWKDIPGLCGPWVSNEGTNVWSSGGFQACLLRTVPGSLTDHWRLLAYTSLDKANSVVLLQWI